MRLLSRFSGGPRHSGLAPLGGFAARPLAVLAALAALASLAVLATSLFSRASRSSIARFYVGSENDAKTAPRRPKTRPDFFFGSGGLPRAILEASWDLLESIPGAKSRPKALGSDFRAKNALPEPPGTLENRAPV